MGAHQFLCDPEVKSFIAAHEKDDVAALALKKPPLSDCPYPLILDQIKVRQKAKIKSPVFYSIDNFIFPSSSVFEQSSSYACALYKASLCKAFSFCDLTAGSGADSFVLARSAQKAVLIDMDADNTAILKHNAEILRMAGYLNADVLIHQCRVEDYLSDLEPCDLIYIDPQRRSEKQKGIFDLSACSPDILSLLPLLREKAQTIMIKTSPVLDIGAAVKMLGCVHAVHVVQWRGECREVLYLLGPNNTPVPQDVKITAVSIDDAGEALMRFEFTPAQDQQASVVYDMPKSYIYEPAPAFMKAGGFNAMAVYFGLSKLHMHTHLYTSDQFIKGFVGQGYRVLDIVSAQAKALPVNKAELSVRNFPMDAPTLRKKLKLSEGAEHRIFACTLADGQKRLIITEKLVK